MRQLQAERTLIDLLTIATAAHNAQLVVFNAASLSVKQQAAIFRQAAAVVGVHGAAFGNMVSTAQLAIQSTQNAAVCLPLTLCLPLAVPLSLLDHHQIAGRSTTAPMIGLFLSTLTLLSALCIMLVVMMRSKQIKTSRSILMLIL